jgi:hypothetical protein
MICAAANGLWLAGCLREAARFRSATGRVRDAQLQVLREILRANEDTGFGRRYELKTITSARDYQTRVPLRSYEAYEPEIRRTAAGERSVLTRERVRLFEPTSGSGSATKLIPYTRSLQDQFQRGIKPWIADLFVNDPDLMRGQAYWSVSPATGGATRTSAGIPIGFDDDSAYVGGWRGALVRAVMAAPASLRHIPDIGRFQYETLLALVRSDSLRLISIWNPTFLSIIVDGLLPNADSLLRDLHQTPRRARALREALKASAAPERHTILWPHLRLVSCWADANAATPAARLAALFPHARLQPKGVIATEGFVSLPLGGRDGCALAVRSHFFEFAPVDSQGSVDETSPLLPHELERGGRYAVILSTGGGLYRYRLNDVVEVAGHEAECPLIRFSGRHELVSDWFGEKLHEAHVAAVLSAALGGGFAMLACDPELSPPAYVLYVESNSDDATLLDAAVRIDESLRQNFHYDYARLLGQLGPVRVFRVERDAAETYVATAIRAGQRAGAVKLPALDRRDGWSARFSGRLIQPTSRSTPSGCAPLRLVR